MLEDFFDEYNRYRVTGERALRQMPDDALNHIAAPDGNSVGMLVHHISGNLISRFTDFLTTDGEKPSRDRDSEFAELHYSREQIERMWNDGWSVLQNTLATLSDADLDRTVTIRNQPLSVHSALCRSVAHVAYHVGQMVLIARQSAQDSWQSLSIPKGGSASYNAAPFLERGADLEGGTASA